MVVKVYISGISGNKEVCLVVHGDIDDNCVVGYGPYLSRSTGSLINIVDFCFTGKETPTEGHHDIGQQEHYLRSSRYHRTGQRR